MLILLALLVIAMNIAAFVLMGEDKRRARAGEWRISEKILFLVTALFGGLGGTLGMLVFRHKTQHWYFRRGFPMLFVIQVALLLFLLLPQMMPHLLPWLLSRLIPQTL